MSVAVRILHGENPSDIPVAESRKKYVVDWNVMRQRGISKTRIPAECTIINIPISEKYPVAWGVGIVVIVVLFSTLFVWLFFLYRREQGRKKRALNELESEKETLALALEGGDTYAWKLENDCFLFEKDFWISQELKFRPISFEELLLFMHPDHWEEVKGYWKDISKAGKIISRVRCDFNGRGYQWWEFRYKTILLPGGGYKAAGLLLNIQAFVDNLLESYIGKFRHLGTSSYFIEWSVTILAIFDFRLGIHQENISIAENTCIIVCTVFRTSRC